MLISFSIPPLNLMAAERLANHELKDKPKPISSETKQAAECIVNNAKQHETVILLKNKIIEYIKYISEAMKELFSSLFKSKIESSDLNIIEISYDHIANENNEIYSSNIDFLCKKICEYADAKHDGLFRVPGCKNKINYITDNINKEELKFDENNVNAAVSYFKNRIKELTVIDEDIFKKIKEDIKSENYDPAVNIVIEKIKSGSEFDKLLKTAAYCYQQASDDDSKYSKNTLQSMFYINLLDKGFNDIAHGVEIKKMTGLIISTGEKYNMILTQGKCHRFIDKLLTQLDKK